MANAKKLQQELAKRSKPSAPRRRRAKKVVEPTPQTLGRLLMEGFSDVAIRLERLEALVREIDQRLDVRD